MNWNSKETLQNLNFWFLKMVYLRKKCQKCMNIAKMLNLEKEKKFTLGPPPAGFEPGTFGLQKSLNDLSKKSLIWILSATYWYYKAHIDLKMSALTCSIEILQEIANNFSLLFKFPWFWQKLLVTKNMYNPIIFWSNLTNNMWLVSFEAFWT